MTILEDTLEAVTYGGITEYLDGHLLVQVDAEDMDGAVPFPEAFEDLDDTVARFAPAIVAGWGWEPCDGIPGRGKVTPTETEWDAPGYGEDLEVLR